MNFLQSQNWKETKRQLGNKIFDVGEYFFHTTPLPIGRTIGYMPRADLTKINWSEFVNKARDAKAIYITIDPSNLKKDFNSIEFLKSKGLTVNSGQPIHLQHTVIIDTNTEEEVLLANLKQKTRYNLKLAQKKGVKVSISNKDSDFDIFNDLYQQTVLRQGYHGRSSEYLKTVWQNFKNENAFILTANYEGVPIVSWFVIAYEDTLTYVYGGSSEEYKNVMAPYALFWELIITGKKYGYRYVDLFGVKSDLSDGYSRFKAGFGGEMVEFADTVDIVIEGTLYKLTKLLSKVRSKLIFR